MKAKFDATITLPPYASPGDVFELSGSITDPELFRLRIIASDTVSNGVFDLLQRLFPNVVISREAADIETDLTLIARQYLDLQTLQTRNSDSLDFKEQSVWSIKEALQMAYEAGRQSMR